MNCKPTYKGVRYNSLEELKSSVLTPQKKQIQEIYSQYLQSLEKPDINPTLQDSQKQVKKFAELQERLNNKEFLEGAKNAFESSEELQQFGTQEQYNDYIARVSLGIIKNPSSGDYNYNSKVKDIVYHNTDEQFESFKVPFYAEDMYGEDAPIGVFFSTDKQYTSNFGKRNISAILNLKNPKFEKEIEYEKVAGFRLGKKITEFDGFYGNDKIDLRDAQPSKGVEYVVFEPEQIHILGGKQDVEGFIQHVSTVDDKIKSKDTYYQKVNDEIEYNDKGEVLAPNGEISKLYKDIELLVEEKNKEQGNLRENITDIANNSKWKHNRKLASFLLDSNFGINSFFKFVDDGMYEDLLKLGGWGLYYKDGDGVKKINIYVPLIKKYFENDIIRQKYYEELVILHETVHLLVFDNLNANEDVKNKLTDLMDFVKTKIDPNEHPNAFKNVHEFVSEAFTDYEFQVALKKIKYKGKLTVWNKFLELINIMAKSLGINTEYSVLEEIVSLTDILFNENKQLSLQLYKQTRSKEFKDWFGDSKVIDENGEPLIVYHGTNSKFDIFNKGNIFFTDSKVYAEGLAENNVYDKIIEGLDYDVIVMPAFLRLVNPKNVDYKIHHITLNEDKFDGYDGIIGKEAVEYNINDYIVFEPNQIKSVFNQGTYSKENPNIAYYGKSPSISPFEKFQQSLNKPDTNPILTGNIKPDIILPIGTSGSGKSTWIKSVNTNSQFVVISPDDMRVEFTGDMNDKSKDDEIYQAVTDRAIQAVKKGKQVIVDTTNLKKERRRPFIDAVKKALPNTVIQYKLLPLNPELAKQRIKADIEAGVNRANVPDSTIDKHAKSYNQMLEDIKSEDISNYDYKEEQEKKFKELQEKLQDETFLEAVKSVFNNSSKLQQFAYETFLPNEDTSMKLSSKEEVLSLYTDYVARIALGIIKNPSSGEYNDSKVNDILHHRTKSKTLFDKFDLSFAKDFGDYGKGFYFASLENINNVWNTNALTNATNVIVPVILNINNPFIDPKDRNSKNYQDFIKKDVNNGAAAYAELYHDSVIDYYEDNTPLQYVVFNPNQIHILDSKQDIEGFEKHIFNKNKQLPIEVLDNTEEIEDIAEADNSPVSTIPKKEVIQLPKTAQLILPIGISGSGKSTWIDSLDKDKYTIISPDLIRKELTGNISDQSKNIEVFAMSDKLLDEALKQGKKVILDSTNLNTIYRRSMISKLKSLYPDLDIRYKVLDVDPNIAKQRIATDISNNKDRSNTPNEIIDLQYEQFLQTKEDIKDEPIHEFRDSKSIVTEILDKYFKGKSDVLKRLSDMVAISDSIKTNSFLSNTDNLSQSILTLIQYNRTVGEMLDIYPSFKEVFEGVNKNMKLSDYINTKDIDKKVEDYVANVKKDMTDNFNDYEEYLSKLDIDNIEDLENYPNDKLLKDLCTQ